MTRPASPPILFDVTRLLTRLRFGAPTGIDRVDLAYADRYLTRGGENGALSLTPLGARLLREDATHAVLDALRSRWRDAAPDASQGAARGAAWLAGPPRAPPPEPSPIQKPTRMRGAADLALRTLGASTQRDAARAAPRGAVYLHTSHLRLDRPAMFRWLERRPDIRPVFFLQDLIPIEYPEYGVPGEAQRHRTRIATISRHAAAVLTSSEAVAESFRGYAEKAGLRPVPRIVTAPIGVETTFSSQPRPIAASRAYFVVCSTIEARKNHLLLLQVWRDLARRLDPSEMPALVIVGRRGWESEAAADLLERCEAIRPHVIEAPNLPTATLASLMAGARALLMPSFSEGYGIPVAEAMAIGTPVIASDLPSHWEITRGAATLLDPLDGIGWREAIAEAARGPAPPLRPGSFPSWPAHFEIVDCLLTDLREQ
jgi:glycosyltransferase involved in cell wall biosynthesis